jgi:HAD superfamily hydrolase (TIGR01450 family)
MEKNSIDTYLFDCDGVLYRSPDQAPGAKECIQSLLRSGKQVFFVTNNAGSNRRQLRDKLTEILELDDDVLTESMMISSSYSSAQYLKRQVLDKTGSGRLYVIGSEGLCEELRQTGFEVFGGPSGEQKASMSRDELAEYDFSELCPIDAVVVGHDTEFTFRKMCIANFLLQSHPKASLVATNEDAFDLVGADARRIPGNGCVVRAVSCFCQVNHFLLTL